MSANLKACPFCGSPAEESRDTAGFYSYFCTAIDCCMLDKNFEHHATGRKAWNRRPAADESAKPSSVIDMLPGESIAEYRFRMKSNGIKTQPASTASKEAVTLSDDARDAARYRWLRETDERSDVFCMYGSNGNWGECGHTVIEGELLDSSIDKQLAQRDASKAEPRS